MSSTAAYLRYTWFVLIMVFLVILAGGVVRMTQSGMGCPDWPTCFGRWIPPTDVSQLPTDYEKYLRKQDIDHTFNVYHTWIEYINRLLGALLGVFIIIHAAWSYRKFWRSNRQIVYVSFFMVLAVAFQGWLGKRVVDANLSTVKVTTHMLVALVIAALPVLVLSRLSPVKVISGKMLKTLAIVALALVLVQIVLGTQVREEVDEISSALKYQHRETWIESLGNSFFIHRSFSWIVALACIVLSWKILSIPSLRLHGIVIISLLVCIIGAGLMMNFMGMPALAQPLHLMFASLLAISLFSCRLQMK
jgi:cytochrome c oxidase assembly protein subunit 15